MESMKELALRCFTMLARCLCPGADDDYPALARRLGLMEADHAAQWAEVEAEAEAEAASADHAAQWAVADHAAAHDGLQAFALGLNKRLAGRSHNLAFSPLSVYVALSLGAAGARERTLEELLGILGAPSRGLLARHVCALAEQALADRSQRGGPCVSFACGVWHDTTMPLRPAYRDVAAESYKAVTRAVNFHQEVIHH